MTDIINKREEYINKIEEIKNIITNEINNYKEKLLNELEDKMAIFTAELNSKYSSEIKKYQERITVLEDIIKEELPIPQQLTTLCLEKEQVEEQVKEHVEEEKVEQSDSSDSIENVSRPGMYTIENPTRS